MVAGTGPSRPPGEDLDLVPIGESRQSIRAGIVRQRHPYWAVFRTRYVDSPAHRENERASANRGRSKRTGRKRHGASLVYGLNKAPTARRPLSARRPKVARGHSGRKRCNLLFITPSVKFPSVPVSVPIRLADDSSRPARANHSPERVEQRPQPSQAAGSRGESEDETDRGRDGDRCADPRAVRWPP
jgi:hypothetical protein